MNEYTPPRWLTIARGLIGYSGYGAGGILFVTLLLPFSIAFGLVPRLRAIVFRTLFHKGCAFLTRVYLPALQVYRIAEISGYNGSRVHQPAIFVANHRGRLDGPLLLGIIRNAGVIMKSKYARQPFFSSFIKHLDFVSVDPSSLESLAETVRRCSKLLADGRNLLVFPEGTRAMSSKLLPFRDFAFRIANNAGVPVIPVAVHSDLPFMAKIKGSHFPRKTFTYRVRFLDPVSREGRESAADFAERVRDILAAELAGLDSKTVWETNPERGGDNAG
jgi:1-acyl-sn-glycerol-3-phosphate acyltransferase